MAGKTSGGRTGRRRDGISVEIVCSIPAGKSLINSGLVRYLTDLKNGKKREKKRGE